MVVHVVLYLVAHVATTSTPKFKVSTFNFSYIFCLRHISIELVEVECIIELPLVQIRGHYYMNVHKLGGGAQWRRTTSQEVYSPLLLAFVHEVCYRCTSTTLNKSLVYITCT